jgi:hypothetical protein
MARLSLKIQADIDALLTIADESGVRLSRAAVEHSLATLTEDWITLSHAGGPNCFCDLSFGKTGGAGYSLPQWADLINSLYELRDCKDIKEQVRRLCITSHERLDTALVVIVAARYHAKGWAVTFEPNGKGCSDLRVSHNDQSFYIEVKRENAQKHDRLRNIRTTSDALLTALYSALASWLERNDCRIQVKFVQGFSCSLLPKICKELNAEVPHAMVGVEQPLTLPKGSQFIVLNRNSGQHYEKGFVSGIVPLKRDGIPIQANDPRNMPIQIICEWLPNFTAVGTLIKKATSQLKNDAKADSEAKGFVVVQARGGDHLGKKIEERLLATFPACCLGVLLLSEMPLGIGYVIARDELDAKTLNALRVAAPGVAHGTDAPYLSLIIVTPQGEQDLRQKGAVPAGIVPPA